MNSRQKTQYYLAWYNSWSWETSFGPIPRYRKYHTTIQEAEAEARRVAQRTRGRGDGSANAVVFTPQNAVIGLPVRI